MASYFALIGVVGLRRKRPDSDATAFPSELGITYTYDALGRIKTMVDASGTTTQVYDARGNLLSKTNAAGTLTYTYDAANNLTTVVSSSTDGLNLGYTYDGLNRLDTVFDRGIAQPPLEHHYSYDDNGNLERLTYANGVSHSWSYDARNRLKDLGIRNASVSTLHAYAYDLLASGHRTRVTESSGRVVEYAYDHHYRLTQERISGAANPSHNGSNNWSYDLVGNRLSQQSDLSAIFDQAETYNTNNWLDSHNYDSNGNTLDSLSSVLRLPTSDTYDWRNRLVRREKSDGTVIEVVYDGNGDRIKKTVTPFGGPDEITWFLVDRNNLTGYAQVVEEIAQGGAVQVIYSYGLDLISQDRRQPDDTWIQSFYLYDGLGSVRGLTDSTGTLTNEYIYDAWGVLLEETPNSSFLTPNSYLFAGEQIDRDLEMYFLRARYLNVATGRFHTMDTFEGVVTDPITLHKYLYANADPVNRIDPSGNLSFVGLMHAIGISRILNSASAVRKIHQARRTMSKLCRIVARPAKGLIQSYASLAKQMRKLNSKSKIGAAAHHVIQNAMLITNLKYSRNIGIAMPLLGKHGQRFTPHWIANQAQRHRRLNKDIRATAFLALRGAGCRNADATAIIDSVEAAYETMGIAVGIAAVASAL